MTSLRKSLCYQLDSVLPSWVKDLPYQKALSDIQAGFTNSAKGIYVWHRNSFYFKNHIFGISDLDLTFYCESSEFRIQALSFKKEILELKNLYPFIGETNYYEGKFCKEFAGSANYFELRRDPTLISQAKLENKEMDLRIDAIVFLLRMIYADYANLISIPYTRQKKWAFHLQQISSELNFPYQHQFWDFEKVLNYLKDLVGGSLEEWKLIEDSVLDLKSNSFSEERVFLNERSIGWRFVFPHRYLWFHFPENRDEDRLKNLPPILKKILLRQIDWEVWGLFGQYPIISNQNEGIKIHLSRLSEVARTVDLDSVQSESIEKFLHHLAK